MLKQVLSAVFVCIAVQAQAQNCPDFFRFVEFGQIGEDGITYRGGTILRAESLTGTPLLLNAPTTCVSVPTRATDGHGNPIPVVTRISYDPSKAGLPISSLSVVRSQDVAKAADANAAIHRERLGGSNITRARGVSFLCAADGDDVSCQLVSPYGDGHDLVVYCNLLECRMPVMAIAEHLLVEATWPSVVSTNTDLAAQGRAVATQVRQLHDFLADLF